MRLLSTLLAIVPLILTILSFTFTVLSTTSKQWAYQNFYAEDGVVVSLDQQITPLWTIYRSPFWTCGRGADAPGMSLFALHPSSPITSDQANGNQNQLEITKSIAHGTV